jgi:hypothetical protein
VATYAHGTSSTTTPFYINVSDAATWANWTATTSTATTYTWEAWNTGYVTTAEGRRTTDLSRFRGQVRTEGERSLVGGDAEAVVAGVLGRYPDLVLTDQERADAHALYDEHVTVGAERRRTAAEAAARQAAADQVAEQFLAGLLDDEQRAEWDSAHRVTHVGADGRVWRLFRDGGVALMGAERSRARLCVHPAQRLPNADRVAALLMALRYGDEHMVIAKANLVDGCFTAREQEIRTEVRAAAAAVEPLRLAA